MKNRIGTLFVLATIIVPGIVAKALTQTGDTNSVTITSTMGGNSQAAVWGTYTVASGYTLVGIDIYVQPTGEGGGQGGEGAANVDGNGNFSTAILVPANATYDIQAILTVTDSNGISYPYFSSLVAGVYVPSGPPG